jgi:hypothetical protein
MYRFILFWLCWISVWILAFLGALTYAQAGCNPVYNQQEIYTTSQNYLSITHVDLCATWSASMFSYNVSTHQWNRNCDTSLCSTQRTFCGDNVYQTGSIQIPTMYESCGYDAINDEYVAGYCQGDVCYTIPCTTMYSGTNFEYMLCTNWFYQTYCGIWWSFSTGSTSQLLNEQCDDGWYSTTCTNTCQLVSNQCGDGIIEAIQLPVSWLASSQQSCRSFNSESVFAGNPVWIAVIAPDRITGIEFTDGTVVDISMYGETIDGVHFSNHVAIAEILTTYTDIYFTSRIEPRVWSMIPWSNYILEWYTTGTWVAALQYDTVIGQLWDGTFVYSGMAFPLTESCGYSVLESCDAWDDNGVVCDPDTWGSCNYCSAMCTLATAYDASCVSITPAVVTTWSVLITGTCSTLMTNQMLDYQLWRFGDHVTWQILCAADQTRSYSSGMLDPGIYEFEMLTTPICTNSTNPIQFDISTCHWWCTWCTVWSGDITINAPFISGTNVMLSGTCNQQYISWMTGSLENIGIDQSDSYIPCINNSRSWSWSNLDAGAYTLDLTAITTCNGSADAGISFDISTCQWEDCQEPICVITGSSLTVTQLWTDSMISLSGMCDATVLDAVQVSLSWYIVIDDSISLTGFILETPCQTGNQWIYTGLMMYPGWIQYTAMGVKTDANCTGSVQLSWFMTQSIWACTTWSIITSGVDTLTCAADAMVTLLYSGSSYSGLQWIYDGTTLLWSGMQQIVATGGIYGIISISEERVCINHHIVYQSPCYACVANQCVLDSSGLYSTTTCDNQCWWWTPWWWTPWWWTPWWWTPWWWTPWWWTPWWWSSWWWTSWTVPWTVRKVILANTLDSWIEHHSVPLELPPKPTILPVTWSHDIYIIVWLLCLVFMSFVLSSKIR